jgi:hypothetical protein
LIAGPDWHGDTLPAIKRVIRVSTPLAFSQFRTQLFNPADINNVRQVQSGYRARKLSLFLHEKAAQLAANIDYPPIDDKTFGPQFWEYANFLLQFCPTLPSESQLRTKFARIGVQATAPWPPSDMPDDVLTAVKHGAEEARKGLDQDLLKLTSSIGLFGTPQQMAGKYRERALGALGGIYGNSAEEAIYPAYMTDVFGEPYDASKFNYTLTFERGQLPPVKAFWSVTMYDLRTKFLVENQLHRYLINSIMLPDLKKDEEGSITLFLQHESPGAEFESNWLPAPDGPMAVIMRLYLPNPEVLKVAWVAPSIRSSGPAHTSHAA